MSTAGPEQQRRGHRPSSFVLPPSSRSTSSTTPIIHEPFYLNISWRRVDTRFRKKKGIDPIPSTPGTCSGTISPPPDPDIEPKKHIIGDRKIPVLPPSSPTQVGIVAATGERRAISRTCR
jgi:hypothetical protein